MAMMVMMKSRVCIQTRTHSRRKHSKHLSAAYKSVSGYTVVLETLAARMLLDECIFLLIFYLCARRHMAYGNHDKHGAGELERVPGIW